MKPALLTLMLLTACTDANHLGNPLTWPGQALQTTVSNAVYDARRAKVADFVATNQKALLTEAKAKSGPTLAAVFDLAKIPQTRHAALTRELATNPAYKTSKDALTIALMAHSA